MEETRGFRFEVVGFGGGEGDWDEGGGDGGLEDGAADASAAFFAALRAATALSIVEFAERDDEGMTPENGKSTLSTKKKFTSNYSQLQLCCDSARLKSLHLIHGRLHDHLGIFVLYPMTTPLDRNDTVNLRMSGHQFWWTDCAQLRIRNQDRHLDVRRHRMKQMFVRKRFDVLRRTGKRNRVSRKS